MQIQFHGFSPGFSACQVTTGSFQMQDNTVAQTLANVCNTVQFGNIMCQGFVYDRHQNVAFFKGQATGQLVDTSRLCTSSNTTAWLSNIGK